MTPGAEDAASAIACDDQAIGVIRYNTATAAFEGCNGVAWADIRNGGAAGAAGLTGQVQFNSGGALAASANFSWDNVNGRLGIGTSIPGELLFVSGGNIATTGAYKIGGTTVVAYPFAGADTTGIAVGPNALTSETANGEANTAVGSGALQLTTIGSYNTALGVGALYSNKAKYYSTAIGYQAMYYADDTTTAAGANNTAVGFQALMGSTTASANTGGANTALGWVALSNNTSGSDNTAIGGQALAYNSAKSRNTVVGYAAMYYADNTTTASDSYNTALGFEALLGSPTPSANTGTNNTAVGTFALAANTSGSYNAALGMNAGQSITSGNNNIMVGEGGNITTGSSNIAIGNNLTFTSATLNSQLDIGDTIFGDLSGKKVGINTGTAAPGTALDVNGGVTMEPVTVTLTANNTVLATANRSYVRVTSDNATETNRIFCFGAGTLGQVLVIEWTSSTNRGEIVSHGNCGAAAGAVTASLSYTNWAPKNAETILQLMYNGTHWIQIAGSANY
jgi:hypothetical protein